MHISDINILWVTGVSPSGATDIPVVAMETQCADCLRAALDVGKPVSIGEIKR